MYFRWRITKTRSINPYSQISELCIYGNSFVQADIIEISSTAAGMNAEESIEKLVDGNSNTKYCTQSNDFVISGKIDSDKIWGYEWYTANDSPERDPASWTFEISSDNENWKTFDSVSDYSASTEREALGYRMRVDWYINSDGIPTNTAFIDRSEKTVTKPFPVSLWRVDPLKNNGIPFTGLMLFEKPSGAFMNARDLEYAYIPMSCKKIGEWAFTNTKLRRVKISEDCEYYPTSFPPDCEIEFYGGGGEYGQLLDSEGYAIVDADGARNYVKE